MALIWQQWHDGVHYQVRRQGSTCRLFANGVQHSEFHPRRLVTGSVWDLLWLPVLFQPPQHCRRVLVLGLGGGSLVPPLRHLADPDLLLGVEKDALHLEVAERFFRVSDFGVETVRADARDFVADWDGPPFDLVIEDLFLPSDRSVSRAVPARAGWVRSLRRLVAPGGTLVMNFGDWREYRHSWAGSDQARRGWQRGFRFSTPDCHNAVIAWLGTDSSSEQLRRRLREEQTLDRELVRGRLNYGVRRLF